MAALAIKGIVVFTSSPLSSFNVATRKFGIGRNVATGTPALSYSLAKVAAGGRSVGFDHGLALKMVSSAQAISSNMYYPGVRSFGQAVGSSGKVVMNSTTAGSSGGSSLSFYWK
jgi:hypothetical protein